MRLKPAATKPRRFSTLTAYSYRVPMRVRKILELTSGSTFPICPRCHCTLDRDYQRFCDRCGQHLSWQLYNFAAVVKWTPKSNNRQAYRDGLRCELLDKSYTQEEWRGNSIQRINIPKLQTSTDFCGLGVLLQLVFQMVFAKQEIIDAHDRNTVVIV